MLKINRHLTIDEQEFEYRFILAGGPGGQNVNKVSSAVQLRFNVLASRSLPPDIRARLLVKEHSRINKNGELVITARRFRSQEQNRRDALERLRTIIQQSATITKARKKSRSSLSVKKRRLAEKRHQADKKLGRKSVSLDRDNK